MFEEGEQNGASGKDRQARSDQAKVSEKAHLGGENIREHPTRRQNIRRDRMWPASISSPALVQFIESHPTAILGAEVFHVWTLGLVPYTDEKFTQYFRHNSFFIA
ncbi:MAG: hypothetical protein ACXU93_02815, partial [Thermodesulfobacteriota bacterium]